MTAAESVGPNITVTARVLERLNAMKPELTHVFQQADLNDLPTNTTHTQLIGENIVNALKNFNASRRLTATDVANIARSLKSYANAVESIAIETGAQVANGMRQRANLAAVQATERVEAQVNKSLQHTHSHVDEFLKLTIDGKNRLIYFADRGANSAEFNITAFQQLMQRTTARHVEKWGHVTNLLAGVADFAVAGLGQLGLQELSKNVNLTLKRSLQLAGSHEAVFLKTQNLIKKIGADPEMDMRAHLVDIQKTLSAGQHDRDEAVWLFIKGFGDLTDGLAKNLMGTLPQPIHVRLGSVFSGIKLKLEPIQGQVKRAGVELVSGVLEASKILDTVLPYPASSYPAMPSFG